MSADILIVQHAEKTAAPGDPGLSERGRRQAAAVAERLVDARPSLLLSSPLARALQTAEAIGAAVGLTPTVVDELCERSSWPGPEAMPEEDFLRDWRRTCRERAFRPRIGDSSHATAARMARALRGAARKARHGPAVLVCHGGATVDLLRDLVGDRQLEHRYPGAVEHGLPGTAVTHVAVGATGETQVVTIGDLGHLPDDLVTGHVPAWT
ncbi:histidine phosphatase family protein [Luteipulveratus sp. YIM 133132]|uniref:Histidine phosphatase family protein n=1 Tax=Luteipulveratus flavus TaxID=3031728 RepID=A0ABT6C5N9_9MICO|nr:MULTISPECIES: histidine phosphatase family protein [unclassified Luteipulveratus]MDE9366468.1 histidine phosphatase family protein [Luteipulveratus sp. YIM 133132]MDF8264258.1 histidine phosphatase family protein [Luteipulveratus sp. YIM 133296]